MANVLSSAYKTFIFAAESTYGVDAVDAAFTANDDIVYFLANAEAEITPMGEAFTPDRARASQSGVAASFIQRGADVSIPFGLVGGDSANNYRPDYADILTCAGFDETTGGSATTFTLVTSQDASGTLYQYNRRAHSSEWRLKRAHGLRLNVNVQGNVGEEAIATAVGMGTGYHDFSAARAYFDASDQPALDADGGALTYTGTASAASDERMICKAATVTYNGVSIPLISFDVDYALGIVPIDQMTGDPVRNQVARVRDGVSPANGNLTFSTSDGGTAYEDIVAALTSDEVADLVIVLSGSSTQLTMTHRIQFTARPAESANAGVMNFAVPFQVVGDFAANPFGDNGVSWVFEAA